MLIRSYTPGPFKTLKLLRFTRDCHYAVGRIIIVLQPDQLVDLPLRHEVNHYIV